MRLPEQRLWDRMRANARGRRALLLNRIENLVGVGDPDVEAIAPKGLVSKIELKAVATPPKRPETPLLGRAHGLSADQENWLFNWLDMGGRAYVLIGIGSEQRLLRLGLHFGNGVSPFEVNGMTHKNVERYAVAGPAWSQIFNELELQR